MVYEYFYKLNIAIGKFSRGMIMHNSEKIEKLIHLIDDFALHLNIKLKKSGYDWSNIFNEENLHEVNTYYFLRELLSIYGNLSEEFVKEIPSQEFIRNHLIMMKELCNSYNKFTLR